MAVPLVCFPLTISECCMYLAIDFFAAQAERTKKYQ